MSIITDIPSNPNEYREYVARQFNDPTRKHLMWLVGRADDGYDYWTEIVPATKEWVTWRIAKLTLVVSNS